MKLSLALYFSTICVLLSLLNSQPGWTQQGPLILESPFPEDSHSFGFSVAGVPDFTGDGVPDFAVAGSELSADGNSATGAVYLFDGLNHQFFRELEFPHDLGGDGYYVDGIEDISGNGLGDIVVGLQGNFPPDYPESPVRAYVYDGATGTLIRELASPYQGSELAEPGWLDFRVAGLSDLNRDGLPEIGVGAINESPIDGPLRAGRAYIFSGSSGELLFEFASPNEEQGGMFGASISPVPDTNGNGVDDLVIGAPGEDPEAYYAWEKGRAYIFDGSSGLLLRTLLSPEEENEGLFGGGCSGIADVNGDGRGDVIVGAEKQSPGQAKPRSGKAFIFDGSTGLLIHSLTSPLNSPSGYFGRSVDQLDANGDGRGDVLVGAPGDSFSRSATIGRAHIIDGSSGALIRTLSAPDLAGLHFGWSVASVPDLNGDHLNEVIVGAPRTNTGSSDSPPGWEGKVYLFYSPGYESVPPHTSELLDEVLDMASASTEYVREGSYCLTILSATGHFANGCLECGFEWIESATDCSSQVVCETVEGQRFNDTTCEWRIGNCRFFLTSRDEVGLPILAHELTDAVCQAAVELGLTSFPPEILQDPDADINGDGVVDGEDLLMLLQDWRE